MREGSPQRSAVSGKVIKMKVKRSKKDKEVRVGCAWIIHSGFLSGFCKKGANVLNSYKSMICKRGQTIAKGGNSPPPKGTLALA